MQSLKTLFYLTLLVFSTSAFAEKSDTSKRFRIHEAFLMGGTSVRYSETGSLNDFNKLATNSVLLQSNFDNFEKFQFESSGIYSMLACGVGFQKADRPGRPTFRIALNIGSGKSIEGSYRRNASYIVDTFISTSTGERIYEDSTLSESYRFNFFTRIISFDMSILWRTQNKNKFTLFGGIGFSAGLSDISKTEISHRFYSYRRAPFGQSNMLNSYHHLEEVETYNNKTQTQYVAYIPFGIDYHLSKKSDFWKQIHLFYEGRIRIEYYDIPELYTNTRFAFGSNIGVRVKM